MPEFKVNVPVVQEDPLVKVEVTEGNALPVGQHRFRLVVVDDAGNASQPAFLTIMVQDSTAPTAALQMVNDNGEVIRPIVPAGASFILSGSESKDTPPGKILRYEFTLMDRA